MQAGKYYFLLTLLCASLFLPGIFSIPLMDRDEAHFVQSTRQMLESGNYFSTQFLDKTRHQKSPAINWLQAASVKVFSDKESNKVWPYRLPSFFGAFTSILILFFYVRKIFDDKTAFLSCALLASSILLIMEAHLALIDAVLLATIISMQCALWKIYQNAQSGMETNNIPLTHVILFWMAMSLGFLLKGVTPLIAFLTLTALFIIDKNIHFLKAIRPLLGIFMFIIITLLWVIPANCANHGNYLWQLAQHDLLPKLQKGVELHGASPIFFIKIFPFFFFPGALFIGFAILWSWKNQSEINTRFLLAWIIPAGIFFSLMPTKLPQYFLPLYPAISILCALGIINLSRERGTFLFRAFQWMILIIWFLVGIGIAVFPLIMSIVVKNSLSLLVYLNAIFFVFFLFISSILFIKRNYNSCITVMILSLAFNLGIFSSQIFPKMQNLWPSQEIAERIKNWPEITDRTPLISVKYNEPSLAFYLGTKKIKYGKTNFRDYKNNVILIPSSRYQDGKIMGNITLYNYSKGNWKKYFFVLVAPE